MSLDCKKKPELSLCCDHKGVLGNTFTLDEISGWKKNVRTRDIDDPIVEVFITAGKQAEEYLIDDNTVS